MSYAIEYQQQDLNPNWLVSVVIPAHNEGERIRFAIESVLRVFEEAAQTVEVIVVDDGSTDSTRQQAFSVAQEFPESVRVVSLGTNRGKGYAIRSGFLQSRGDVVGFIDADLEYPVNALPIMADMVLESGRSCAIASRVADNRRSFERLSSQIAHKVASAMLRLPIRDTQAGIKMFPGAFARHVLTNCQQGGWLYDIEALLRAVQERLDIIEVPVMQKSVRRRRASLWTMLACGPALMSLAVAHWQALRRNSAREFRQVARFGVVGLINSVVDLTAYWGLVELWSPHRNGFQAGFESLLAWIVASLVGYALHSRYTFQKRLSHSGFYVVTGIGVAIQVAVTGSMTHAMGSSDAVFSKLAGILIASLFTYVGYRYIAKANSSVIKVPNLVRRANIPTVVPEP